MLGPYEEESVETIEEFRRCPSFKSRGLIRQCGGVEAVGGVELLRREEV